MWAMIPMFSTFSRPAGALVAGVAIELTTCSGRRPAGLGHAVEVVLALEGAALLLERVEKLAGELRGHPLLPALARERHDPADREGAGTASRHLDGHLVARAADAARAGLEHRRHRLHRLLEHLDRSLPVRSAAIARAS